MKTVNVNEIYTIYLHQFFCGKRFPLENTQSSAIHVKKRLMDP